MAFGQEASRAPTTIGSIQITLFDPIGLRATIAGTYVVQVLDQNGQELKVLTGDLQPHLTAQQINGLIAFMGDLRAQAAAQIIP